MNFYSKSRLSNDKLDERNDGDNTIPLTENEI